MKKINKACLFIYSDALCRGILGILIGILPSVQGHLIPVVFPSDQKVIDSKNFLKIVYPPEAGNRSSIFPLPLI